LIRFNAASSDQVIVASSWRLNRVLNWSCPVSRARTERGHWEPYFIQAGTFREMEDSMVEYPRSTEVADDHVRPVPEICRGMRGHGQIYP